MAKSFPNIDSFQSIGVTKDWRPGADSESLNNIRAFPINRRHQGLATERVTIRIKPAPLEFPINRRHQGLATM